MLKLNGQGITIASRHAFSWDQLHRITIVQGMPRSLYVFWKRDAPQAKLTKASAAEVTAAIKEAGWQPHEVVMQRHPVPAKSYLGERVVDMVTSLDGATLRAAHQVEGMPGPLLVELELDWGRLGSFTALLDQLKLEGEAVTVLLEGNPGFIDAISMAGATEESIAATIAASSTEVDHGE